MDRQKKNLEGLKRLYHEQEKKIQVTENRTGKYYYNRILSRHFNTFFLQQRYKSETITRSQTSPPRTTAPSTTALEHHPLLKVPVPLVLQPGTVDRQFKLSDTGTHEDVPEGMAYLIGSSPEFFLFFSFFSHILGNLALLTGKDTPSILQRSAYARNSGAH